MQLITAERIFSEYQPDPAPLWTQFLCLFPLRSVQSRGGTLLLLSELQITSTLVLTLPQLNLFLTYKDKIAPVVLHVSRLYGYFALSAFLSV